MQPVTLLLLLLLVEYGIPQALAQPITIPAGWFTMGNDGSVGYENEYPAHPVYVSQFEIDKTLVRKDAWDSVLEWAVTNGYSFVAQGLGKTTNHPVHTVTWYDAVLWCNARSQLENRTPCYYEDAAFTRIQKSLQGSFFCNWAANGYRLPTEAEWEKAARGGASGLQFPYGNTISWSQANFAVNGDPSYDPEFNDGFPPYTSPVNRFPPNGYGLQDMAGNLTQYCWDYFDAAWYGSAAATLPDPHGPATGTFRICRGGAWRDSDSVLRCATRQWVSHGAELNWLGFRCVRTSGSNTVSLVSLAIPSPSTVPENSTNGYTCTATYSDGSISNVSAYASWSITNNWAAGGGFHFEQGTNLVTGEICTDTTNITLKATYSGMPTTKSVTVTDVPPAASLYLVTDPDHPVRDAQKQTTDLGCFRQEYFHDQKARLSVIVGCGQETPLTLGVQIANPTNTAAPILSIEITNTFPVAQLLTNIDWQIDTNTTPPGHYAFRFTLREPCRTNLLDSTDWALTQHRVHVVRGNPVILVHGIGSSATGCWGDMQRLLCDTNHFATVGFDYSAMTDEPDEPAKIEHIAAALRGMPGLILDDAHAPITGSDNFFHSLGWTTTYFNQPKVDVIAHSMGGLVTRAYMSGMATNDGTNVAYGGEIDRLITLASPLCGRNWASGGGYWVPSLQAAKKQLDEMTLGSSFLWNLHSLPPGNYTKQLAIAAGATSRSVSVASDSVYDLVVEAASACSVTMAGESRCIGGYQHIDAWYLGNGFLPIAAPQLNNGITHQGYIAVSRYLQDLPATNGVAFANLQFNQAPIMVRCHDAAGNGVSCNVSVNSQSLRQIDSGFGTSGGTIVAGAARIVMAVPNLGKSQPVLYGIAVSTTNIIGGTLALVDITMPPTTIAANQISESFAQTYFQTSAASVNPNDDPDHDGLNNYLEQQMGLDPTDPKSSIRIEVEHATVELVGANIVFKQPVKTSPGFLYRLESRQSPSDPWLPASNEVVGAGQWVTLEASNPANQAQIYRLRVH